MSLFCFYYVKVRSTQVLTQPTYLDFIHIQGRNQKIFRSYFGSNDDFAQNIKNGLLELEIENSNSKSSCRRGRPILNLWMADNAFSADVACLLQKSSYIFFSFDSNHCCSCYFFGSIIAGAHTYNCFVWVFLARGYLDQKLLFVQITRSKLNMLCH